VGVRPFLKFGHRFISRDFNHKPWNKFMEFSIHIHPKKNISLRLAKERFTRLSYLYALTLYYDKEVFDFLSKYDNITNNLACILRCFEDMDFLRVFCAVGAILGIHLIEPYVQMTSSKVTTYENLVRASSQLFQDLTNNDPITLLQFKTPAFSFVSQERFESTKYDPEILAVVSDVAEEFRPQVRCILKMPYARGDHGLPKISLGSAMPNLLMPCRRPPHRASGLQPSSTHLEHPMPFTYGCHLTPNLSLSEKNFRCEPFTTYTFLHFT
jgi:hypothetical protein